MATKRKPKPKPTPKKKRVTRDATRALVSKAKRSDEAPLRELLKSTGLCAGQINTIVRAIRESEAGRPRAEVDQFAVQLLISKGNTVADVASALGVSKDTLERNCMRAIELGRCLMRGNLRVLQFKHAETSYAMAIFLGKQYLGQSDVLRTDKFTDDELLARAREAGIDIGALVPPAPAAEAQSDDPAPVN